MAPANDVDIQQQVIDALKLELQDVRDDMSSWRQRALSAEDRVLAIADATREVALAHNAHVSAEPGSADSIHKLLSMNTLMANLNQMIMVAAFDIRHSKHPK